MKSFIRHWRNLYVGLALMIVIVAVSLVVPAQQAEAKPAGHIQIGFSISKGELTYARIAGTNEYGHYAVWTKENDDDDSDDFYPGQKSDGPHGWWWSNLITVEVGFIKEGQHRSMTCHAYVNAPRSSIEWGHMHFNNSRDNSQWWNCGNLSYY
jgi:hypothetical protein